MGTPRKNSPRPGRGTPRRQGQPHQPGTAPAFGRPRSHSPTVSLQPRAGSSVRASPRGKPPATRAQASRSSYLRRRAFPEQRSLPARAEVVRLTWPGCGAARREEHLHRPQTRGASLGGSVAGPDRGRARAVWGAFGRAESGRRRRGRSRGDQAQRRTTPTRSVVRSSASPPLRRRYLGTRAEAQGQLRGPARPWRLFGQPVPRSEEPEAAAGASAGAASPPGVAIETGWRAQQKPRGGGGRGEA